MSVYYTGVFSGTIITFAVMMFVIAYLIHRYENK